MNQERYIPKFTIHDNKISLNYDYMFQDFERIYTALDKHYEQIILTNLPKDSLLKLKELVDKELEKRNE